MIKINKMNKKDDEDGKKMYRFKRKNGKKGVLSGWAEDS